MLRSTLENNSSIYNTREDVKRYTLPQDVTGHVQLQLRKFGFAMGITVGLLLMLALRLQPAVAFVNCSASGSPVNYRVQMGFSDWFGFLINTYGGEGYLTYYSPTVNKIFSGTSMGVLFFDNSWIEVGFTKDLSPWCTYTGDNQYSGWVINGVYSENIWTHAQTGPQYTMVYSASPPWGHEWRTTIHGQIMADVVLSSQYGWHMIQGETWWPDSTTPTNQIRGHAYALAGEDCNWFGGCWWNGWGAYHITVQNSPYWFSSASSSDIKECGPDACP